MFENLKLRSHKGLNECKLLSLGKINVLCGKNNSGKSTILEAISSAQANRFPGKVVDSEMTEKIIDDSFEALQWLINRKHSPIAGAYSNMVRQLFGCKIDNLWFLDEHDGFIDQIRKGFESNNMLRGQPVPDKYFSKVYNELFPIVSSDSVVLLPAKRQLETQTAVRAHDELNPTGKGILDYLFMAHTQEPGSQARKFYDAIEEAFKIISDGYTFHIRLVGVYINLMFSLNGSVWRDAAHCGLGLQDLLVILYFSIDPTNRVVLIEEPESHIHPAMQRKLLYYLKEEVDKQFFFSTHSNVFLDNSLINKTFVTSCGDQVRVADVTNKAFVLNELGYSVADNLISDLVILTEGPKDVIVMEEFLTKMGLLKDYNIKIWPLGGDIMDQIDLSALTQNLKVVALIDNDPGSRKIRKQFMENCEKNNVKVTKLKRYSIENYFTLEALRAVFGSQIPETVNNIEHDKKLEEQIGINVKNNSRKIAREMKLSDIEGTDLYRFFDEVAATLAN